MTTPITPAGHQRLLQELSRLKTVDRPEVTAMLAAARTQGTREENAEMDSAQERQAFVEGRIAEIEDKIARSQVIDPASIRSQRIAFGATVSLLDQDSDEKLVYTLVGPDEADARAKRLSVSSPVGRALIGREVGDEVSVEVPGKAGIRNFEVLGFEFTALAAA